MNLSKNYIVPEKPIDPRDIYNKDFMRGAKEYARKLMQKTLAMSMAIYSQGHGKN